MVATAGAERPLPKNRRLSDAGGMENSEEMRDQPTVSRRLGDGRLVELIYDAETRSTAFAIGDPSGQIELVETVTVSGGERLTPYSPHNNLITTGCVLLPSRPEPYGDTAALLDEIRGYLRRYVDLSPEFETIAAHYALLTWVYDAFREVPYLRFRGDYGTGKTRALLTLGAICYKPFFASGASTVSPIFHILDAFAGTLVLDEADFRFTDATAGLTKILNNGNVAGLPVLRSVPNRHKEYSPRAYRVFGPKLVGMRERFADDALESRFLTEETGQRSLRPEVPLQTPVELHQDALALRNKLLSWRFDRISRVEVCADRAVAEIDARRNQVALPLLSLMETEADRMTLAGLLRAEQARADAARADTLEALIVRSALAFFAQGPGDVRLASLAERLSAAEADRGRPITPKWLGWVLRTRLQLHPLRIGGVYVLPRSAQPRLEALAQRYRLAAP